MTLKRKKLENIKMKAVKLNNSNVYSGVKFLNLVKKGRKIKIRIFIKE